MPRIKLTIQYKGTAYCGWQVQPNGATIQGIVEKILHRLFQKKINVIGSGRTDSGVHALGQVGHFDLNPPTPPLSKGGEGGFFLDKFLHSLNSLLPPDIAVIDAEIVPDTFHAQKSAKRKVYEYFILNSRTRSPFLTEYVWQIPVLLDLKKMRQAGKMLVGEHDFKAFCASDSTVKTTVRHIYRVAISILDGPLSPWGEGGGEGEGQHEFTLPFIQAFSPKGRRGLIRITIIGNGFLKQMVRNIVGTLVEVGKGRMTLAKFRKVFKGRDRRHSGATAPARGLVLRKVVY